MEILDAEGKRVITHPRSLRGDKPTDSGDPSEPARAVVRPAGGLAQQPEVRDAMPTRFANGSTRRTRPRGATTCVPCCTPTARRWRAAVAGMLEILRSTGGTDRAGVCLAAAHPPRAWDPWPTTTPWTLSEYDIAYTKGGQVNQKNGRTDPGPLRERARACSSPRPPSTEETLRWATPRQLDAIDRMLATELANRGGLKRAGSCARPGSRCPKLCLSSWVGPFRRFF